MPKLFFLFLLIFTGLVSRAQYPGYTQITHSDDFKARFADASGRLQSLSCDFNQEKNMSVLAEKIHSRGKFYFKRESNVRMEYTQPFQYLMILTGTHIYIRDGQKENSVSTKSSKLFAQINQLVIDCVRGTAINNPDFSVRLFEGTDTYLIELTPLGKSMKDLFKTINITLDKKDFTASKIDMLEPSGDNTLITFFHKELNTTLADGLFTLH
jgi:outer membrane lipoprotein-sorting protein